MLFIIMVCLTVGLAKCEVGCGWQSLTWPGGLPLPGQKNGRPRVSSRISGGHPQLGRKSGWVAAAREVYIIEGEVGRNLKHTNFQQSVTQS
jgi:hypothetical protein